MSTYTQDYLLDKQIKIFQPVDGYRASTDAILLASVLEQVKTGDKILDVGSGTGAISLCLAHRLKDKMISIYGFELQETLCELSNKSAQENNFQSFLKYINLNIKEKPQDFDFCSFDHVITNPPYSEKDMPSPNLSKATAHNHTDFSLKDWISFCIKMLKPKGFFYMINRAEAVDEILSCLHKKLGNICIIPLHSKANQDAKRVIIIAQKDSKAPTTLKKGIIIHEEDGNYSSIANQILRLGKAFSESL
ncbi:MAG: methyltransferase [Alphaproteobacteria bacterium]|nr:methyltransferase [Alphaproteobacteria bacterium]